ncbi:fungal-specific transcription factor domain-containing protein [Pyronema domesticum]|nr:fungal-specific transcription factor domain-containing protein [Pyronema domesticum]
MSLQVPAGAAQQLQQPAGIPISKLPSTRRYTSEARENMNCKSYAVPKKRGPKTEVLEELLKRIDGLEKRLGESEGSNGGGRGSKSPGAESSNASSVASRRPAAATTAREPAAMSPPNIPAPSPPPPIIESPITTGAGGGGVSPVAIQTPQPAPPQTDYRLMQRLVEIFFERVNGKPYTLFHERMFRQDWQEGRVPSYVLDTICAVSVRYASAHELGTKTAHQYCEEFAARARRNVDSDEPTLEHLQSLLLLSMTYYAMGYGKKSFMQMGSAIRMTLALDLHRELPPTHPSTPLQREIRRRVFWTCYMMDRFTVCGSVRPPSFSDRSIHLRLPSTEDSFLRGIPSEAPLFSETGIGFSSLGISFPNSNLLIDVVRILGRTIRYTQSGGVKGDSHFPWHTNSNLSRIRNELNTWASTRDLREGVPPTPDATSLFLARSVWHVIHCLMYRSFLPIDLAELDGNGTQQAWQMEATKVCFQHANALVDLISVGAMTPAIEWPAFAGFSLVTAASVLVHGVFYKGSGAFRKCRENLITVLTQVRALISVWSCMRQQLALLRRLYQAHEKLVVDWSPQKRPGQSVFHFDDFFDRYGGGFEAGHVPFYDAGESDTDLSYIGVPPVYTPSNLSQHMSGPSPPAHHHSQHPSNPHNPTPSPPQQPRYQEDYPFSPTTPQDLQFLSVASFGGHAYDFEAYNQSNQYQQSAEEVDANMVRDMGETERDPLLSMLAEMAERDEFAVGDGEREGDVWMGGGEEGTTA